MLAHPAQAQTVVFSDDFSSNLTLWEPTRDSGEFWSIQDEQLHAVIPQGFTISELVPKATLWSEDWKNIIYELDFKGVSGVDKNISFHFQDLYNWYELHFTRGGMEIIHYNDGLVTFRKVFPATIHNGITYHLKLVLNENTIQFYLDDTLVFDEVDPSFANDYGRVGLKAGTGSIAPTHIIIDNVKISQLGNTQQLGVKRVSQLDERWTSEEYDSATSWSPDDPSIGAWGCALSSMVMIMDYHGISQFNDGTSITPSTLNQWLLTQPDGYIGNGLLNWLAVTRLTNTISETYQTPKLEFSLAQNNLTQTLTTELEHHRPAIIAIPGHFLVAEGIVSQSEPTDFYIKDPAYTYELLSEHSTQIRSLRLFTPSFTDLSYFLLTSHEELGTLQISTKDGKTIPVEVTTDSLLSSDKTTSTNQTYLYYVPKPESDEYTITFTGEFAHTYTINLFTYTKDGQVNTHTLTNTFGIEPEKYSLLFDNQQGQSELRYLYTTQTFESELSNLYAQQKITSHFVWYELTHFARLVQQFHNQKQEISADMSEFLVQWSDQVSLTVQNYLQSKFLLL